MPTMQVENPSAQAHRKTERRRRLAARFIDLIGVGFASMFTFWLGAIIYSASVGCVNAGFQRACGDNKAGGAIGLGIIFIALALPLLYECAFRRTLGKTLFGLEMVGGNGEPVARVPRLKRAFAVWVPVMVLFTGTTATSGGASTVFGSTLTLYTMLLLVLVIARQPTPYDWLSGSRGAYRPKPAEGIVYPKAVRET